MITNIHHPYEFIRSFAMTVEEREVKASQIRCHNVMYDPHDQTIFGWFDCDGTIFFNVMAVDLGLYDPEELVQELYYKLQQEICRYD